MASLRRSKALSPEGQTARFLYKPFLSSWSSNHRLEPWPTGLDITNGNAARMRFSGFKQHMEGIPIQSRNSRPKKGGGKDIRVAKWKWLKRGWDDDANKDGMKVENGAADEAGIKHEPENGVRAPWNRRAASCKSKKRAKGRRSCKSALTANRVISRCRHTTTSWYQHEFDLSSSSQDDKSDTGIRQLSSSNGDYIACRSAPVYELDSAYNPL